MTVKNELIRSVGVGLTVGLVVITLGYILDLYIDVKLANFIALSVGLIYNYFMQQMVFGKSKQNTNTILMKYIVADIFILLSNQGLMNYLIDNETEFKKVLPKDYQQYYITLCRLLVGALVWVLLAFPIRKYWVF